jgi:transcriptional regulator NrdR family protein
MKCPRCNYANSGIIESRKRLDHVWRRRRCYECNHVWHTIEVDKDLYMQLVRAQSVPNPPGRPGT